MAQRPIWRGQLRLALVSCPVALYAAHHDRGALHFNLLNPKTGNRIRMVTQDAETGEPLVRSDLVKGYAIKRDSYVILSDEDFEAARVESSSTLKIEKFVEAQAINPIYYEASYYLAPDGDGAEDVYAVLRDAIGVTGKVALSHVVIARREHPVAIMPMGKGLVLHTLHQERELNDPAELFGDLPASKPDPDMIDLAKQLIERQSGIYAPSDTEDRYEARLRTLIEAKAKGEGLEPEEETEADQGNVIDLMAALRRSLGETAGAAPRQATRRGKSTAKPPAKSPSQAPTKSASGGKAKPVKKLASPRGSPKPGDARSPSTARSGARRRA